jgi:hypothetical protein
MHASAHIMGVVASEIASEITMEIEITMANSRNRRPTMPPINKIGMKTAISDTLIDSTVKPTSLAPLSEASSGLVPSSM